MNPAGLSFNYRSARAVKARFGNKLIRRPLLLSLKAVTIVSFVVGLAMVVALHMVSGWLVCIPGSLALTLFLWIIHDLQQLPLGKSISIDGLLDPVVLGRLSPQPTPQEVARVNAPLLGGRFYGARFAIDPKIIIDHSSTQPADMAAVWDKAYHIAQAKHIKGINSMCVSAALILSVPAIDQYLAQLQLDADDIIAGVAWQSHLNDIVEAHKEPPLYGGIARDWSFGFTPLLERFGFNLTQHAQNGVLARNLEGHDALIGQTLQLLSSSARRNAVLVGGVGSGRTTLVQMLALKLIDPTPNEPPQLHYNQVVALDPATLISRAGGRGELENLVQQLFVEALKAKNIILFLDDAQLFLEDGTGSVNLSNILLPVLEGGALRIILAMDQQRWLQLSQTNPALGQLMNMVNVAPLTREDTMKVMEDQLVLLEHQTKVTIMYQAMREAYNLSERYIPDQVMPGRALKLLESATRFPDAGGFVSPRAVQQAVEQSYGIKVSVANNAQERDTLLNLETLIHQRMINQTRAVKVVSDALRRARAGVRNQSRPIGTFLFLGPTGVGKTELAKCLAAVYFGGEDRLVRIDLNEYVRSDDLIRLIATGAQDPHSLAAQIAKQPFSVVLLDEIEKAHPDVLSALLQLLDEGILRDSSNREVSFRDAIVIATSNAGAQQIREHIDRGEQVEQFEEQLTNELINSNQFRPEFLNRFDEIVVFRPLTMQELTQVIDLIINSINKTLGAQKISVALTDAAKQMLVQMGYDPRLGARPMRRVVQRTVENIMAQRMLSGQIAPGQQVMLDVPDIQNAAQS